MLLNRILSAIVLLILPSTAVGESTTDVAPEYELQPKNSDCPHAIEVTESVFGPTSAPEGPGKIMEFSGNPLGNRFFIEKEHHTVWYYFTMPADGKLTFEIIPEDIKDDYDFMLFRKEKGSDAFCRDVRRQEIRPVRTNISRNNPNSPVYSRTGLAKDATKKYVPAGPGDDFSKALPVKKGQVYYLLVDNVYEGGAGHTLKINFPEPKGEVTASVADKKAGQYTDAMLKLEVPGKPDLKKSIAYEREEGRISVPALEEDRTHLLTARKEGYFFQSKSFRPSDKDRHLLFELLPVEVNVTVPLNNIHFKHNQTVLMSFSRPELQSLLELVNAFPDMVIRINGHVNGPSRPNTEHFQELSANRARKIHDFLVEEGIDAGRLSYKGFGNTKMLYPRPRTQYEMQQNRRVEIYVESL